MLVDIIRNRQLQSKEGIKMEKGLNNISTSPIIQNFILMEEKDEEIKSMQIKVKEAKKN